jgi:hypothetical protein
MRFIRKTYLQILISEILGFVYLGREAGVVSRSACNSLLSATYAVIIHLFYVDSPCTRMLAAVAYRLR